MNALGSFLVDKYQGDSASVLEIAPWHNVCFAGDNVEYFDIMDRESSVEKAEKDPNLAKLLELRAGIPFYGFPYVHHVNKHGDLSQINKKYNLVFSSHVVEHTLCFVRHLNQVYDLLYDGCYYVLVLPDKRYCLDHYIPPSTLGNVLEDFYLCRKTYSLRTLIHSRLLRTHNDAARHWAGDHGVYNDCRHLAEQETSRWLVKGSIGEEIKNYLNNSKGFDFHNYQFTPDSFEEMMAYLKKMSYINFGIHEVIPTQFNELEFAVVLKKE